MTAADVYNFEVNVPDAIVPAFTNAGLSAFTLSSTVDFQKLRPRSELTFKMGGSINPPRIALVNNQPNRRAISAYTGDLRIDSIAVPDDSGKLILGAYRAQIRALLELDTLRAAVNIPSSPYQIDFIMSTGSDESIKTDEGYELTKMTYAVQFSIKQDAFDQLAAA